MRQLGIGVVVIAVCVSWAGAATSQGLHDATAIEEFQAANACVLKHDYDCAIGHFQASWDAEQLPLTLYNIGRMHEFKREFIAARDFWQRFLDAPGASDPVYLERARTGIEMADMLHPRTVGVEVRTADRASVTVDGEPVGTGPVVTVTVAPGEHLVAASLAGHHPWEARVSVAGDTLVLANLAPESDQEPTKVIVEKPVPAAPSPLVVGGWAATGAGGVALAFGVLANLHHNETLDRLNAAADAGDLKRHDALQADLENLQLASGLGYVVAGVALTTGAVLLWLGYADTESEPSASAFSMDLGPGGIATTLRW